MHRRMLALPWADVLTTNWDTLLERSVESNPDLAYDIVIIPADIARTSSPRVVKLHGSLPSNGPFIFAEEDFRTYPRKFAPFVNLARQVLLENELCLIGFSGDDPNFLEWSGWVRDQLGDAARPIRLVGHLGLSGSRRRLLEKRNITPIDLAPLVWDCPKPDRHDRATEIFLKFLEKGKPRKATWRLTSAKGGMDDLADADARLRRLAKIWEQERKAHPGWLVTPAHLRLGLQTDNRLIGEQFEADLGKVSKSVRISVLYEAVWRWETALLPLPEAIEDAVCDAVATDEDGQLELKRRVHVRAAIVRAARHRRDWADFEKRVKYLERLNVPEGDLEAVHERCLKARDNLDYEFVAAQSGNIVGHDPIWTLRRAALVAEVGDIRSAVLLIHRAYREIRKRRAQDRRSVSLLSREAWVLWLMRLSRSVLELTGFEDQTDWPLEYKAADTDPWDEYRRIDDKIARAERERREASMGRRRRFDVGAYSTSGLGLYGYPGSSPYYEVNRLTEYVGIPLRLGGLDLFGSKFAQAVQVSQDRTSVGIWAAVRAAAVHDLKSVDRQFSRVEVARLPFEVVSDIAAKVRRAIEFGEDRLKKTLGETSARSDARWDDRICNLIDLLSRLAIRFEGDAALDVFRFGASWAHRTNVVHLPYFGRMSNLLKRSLHALEPERHVEAAFDVLSLPLPPSGSRDAEIAGRDLSWIGPFEALANDAWRRSERTAGWSAKIGMLLDVIAEGTNRLSRRDATYRLVELCEAGGLTETETMAFRDAIWRHTGDDGFPAHTELLRNVFLKLPGPEPDEKRRLFDTAVVSKLSEGTLNEELLVDLTGASYGFDGKYEPYSVERQDALSILDHALAWHPSPNLLGIFGRGERTGELIGNVLASTILPSLAASGVDDDRVRKFLSRVHPFTESNGTGTDVVPELIVALPALMACNEHVADEVIEIIQKGLISQKRRVVDAALRAVLWFEDLPDRGMAAVPKELVQETISICLMRREPGLVYALHRACLFVKAGVVSESDRNRLVSVLDLMRSETDYENWVDEWRGSDVGLVRKYSVRLAMALKDSGMGDGVLNEWLDGVRSDPMPEVRYALRAEEIY